MRIRAIIVVFILVVGTGCNKETKVNANKEQNPTVSETTASNPVEQPSPEQIQLKIDVEFLSRIIQSTTLDEAILNARPRLGSAHQAKDEISLGAAGLEMWASENLDWNYLSGLPTVTYAEFRKEETMHTGKRICANTFVIEIYSKKTTDNKIQQTATLTEPRNPNNIYTAFLYKSTNGVYQGSTVRFCGIAVENKQYNTVGNKRKNSIVVLGVLDLPENH